MLPGLYECSMLTVPTALLVGLLWGVTNSFIKQGSVRLEVSQQQGAGLCSWLQPSLLTPWLLNQTGSILFVTLLASADISKAVPIANAVSIAANAVTDMCLGEQYIPHYLVPGCMLVAAGVLLCLS